MKSPHLAAALVVFPLIMSVLGTILSMQKAGLYNASYSMDNKYLRADWATVVNFGNKYSTLIKSRSSVKYYDQLLPLNLSNIDFVSNDSVILPIPTNVCPLVDGKETCESKIDPNVLASALPERCIPSSVAALINVNQLFASVAIILQFAMTFALCIGKGTRMMHQILNAIVIIALVISVSTMMSIPRRLFQVCQESNVAWQQLQSTPGFVFNVSYSLDVGGQPLPATKQFLPLSHNVYNKCNRFLQPHSC
jgi:hypothetical protein